LKYIFCYFIKKRGKGQAGAHSEQDNGIYLLKPFKKLFEKSFLKSSKTFNERFNKSF